MQAAAALLILTAVSLIGFVSLPASLRSRGALAVPLSVPIGSLIAGWTAFVAGVLLGTRVILPLVALLTALALVRGREWARALRAFARYVAALARANLLATVALAVVVALALPQLLIPLSDSDGLAYQLAMPKLYLLTSHITFVPWTYASALPQTINMLYLLGLRIAGGETAKFLHFGFFLMSLVTLALLVHRDRRTRRAAFIAPLLYAAAPVVLAPAGAAFLEHAATLAIAAAALALFRSASPLAAGLSLAAALATKLQVLPAIAGVWLYGLTKRSALALTLPMVIAFAPFAIRNVVHTGDPMFPLLSGLLHRDMPGVNAEGVARTAYFHSRVPGPMGIGWTPDPQNVQGDEVAGLHHVLGLFALALPIRSRSSRRWLAIILPFIAVAVFFRPPTRYIIPMFFALAALEAEALVRLARRWATAIAIVAVIPAAIASASFTFTSRGPFDYLARRIDRRTFLETRVPGYRAAEVINAQRTAGRVMALDFPAPFYFDRPWIAEGMINDPPLQQIVAGARNVDDILSALRAMDVRYLVVTPGYGGGTPSSLLPLARNRREAELIVALRKRLRLLATVERIDIAELPAAEVGGPTLQ